MTVVVLVALPMQKDISSHLPGAAAPPPMERQITVTRELPTAHRIPTAPRPAMAHSPAVPYGLAVPYEPAVAHGFLAADATLGAQNRAVAGIPATREITTAHGFLAADATLGAQNRAVAGIPVAHETTVAREILAAAYIPVATQSPAVAGIPAAHETTVAREILAAAYIPVATQSPAVAGIPAAQETTVAHGFLAAADVTMATGASVADHNRATAGISVAGGSQVIGQVRVAGGPTPGRPIPDDRIPDEPRSDDPKPEDTEAEETGEEEPDVDATAQVTLKAPTVGIPLAGTFTAKVVTWDTSAAAMRLNQQDAARHVAEAGLKLTSTGRCTDRRRPSCTSLESIRYGTLMRLIDLKRASGCEITITGGTETGHADGRYSHSNGYKIDIAHNKCIDTYIRKKFRRLKSRGDGSTLYRPPSTMSSAVYADERTHWDILFL